MKPAALDLFCGAAGGWSLGLHRAGVETMAACEIDDWRRAVFAANNPAVRMYADVRCLTASRLLADLGRLPDWIVGSPPCQDASSANPGGKGVDGERTGLFFEAIRLVAECRPAWVCLENVPGIRNRGADRIIAELEAIQYTVWPLVVGARHVGAPHKRDRVWFVAANAAPVLRAPIKRPQSDGDRASGRHVPAADPHAHGGGQHGRAGDGEMGGRVDRAPADADQVRREGVARGDEWRRAAEAQSRGHGGLTIGTWLPAALRDFGGAWPHWNGGLSGLLASFASARAGGVDDGVPAGMAPAVRNASIAAYGDAVLPTITEAIARSILAVERAEMRAAA